eukprot:Pompholyxophrys_punicea_v1_NODE_123_length_3345_cov_12.350334.p3 type:complete len:114 gc:universal NODE_123_length_3345_cov_12.350334:2206-2547(+)
MGHKLRLIYATITTTIRTSYLLPNSINTTIKQHQHHAHSKTTNTFRHTRFQDDIFIQHYFTFTPTTHYTQNATSFQLIYIVSIHRLYIQHSPNTNFYFSATNSKYAISNQVHL